MACVSRPDRGHNFIVEVLRFQIVSSSERRIRAVSPVIGTVLLIAIVVALGGVGAVVFFGSAETSDPAPSVHFDNEDSDGEFEQRLIHDGGDKLDGERVELRGAADPDTIAGENLSAGDEVSFYAVDEEVRVVWYSESDTSYVLSTIEAEETIPEPDEGCDWVDDETNGGVDQITINGIVVNCDVDTNDQITVRNGAILIGEALSGSKELDLDDSDVFGDVNVEKVLNGQDSDIMGDATSRTEDVKVDNGTVGGSIDAEKTAEATSGTVVEGDMESQTSDAKVLQSTVEGSVTADDIVKLDDALVEGHVYADPSDFDCTDSTINGQDCSSYTPRDPSNWPG